MLGVPGGPSSSSPPARLHERGHAAGRAARQRSRPCAIARRAVAEARSRPSPLPPRSPHNPPPHPLWHRELFCGAGRAEQLAHAFVLVLVQRHDCVQLAGGVGARGNEDVDLRQ